MYDIPCRRGRRLVASAVAFLLPARLNVPFVFQTQTCTPRVAISSVPPCPAHIAARSELLTTARENRYYFNGGGSALFAAAARKEEDAEEQQRYDAEADPTNTKLLPPPGGSAGRIAKLRGQFPKRWKRLRSTAVARALGRVFRGRSGVEEHDRLNSVVSGTTQRQSADRGGRGLLSPFRSRRRQGLEHSRRSDPAADGRLAGAGGQEGRGEDLREREEERLHGSRNVVVAAAAAAAAGSDGSGAADGPAAVGGRRAVAPAKYDGEEVVPETWAKVDELRARAESSDPNAGEEERGVHAWLAAGGEGLTDVDLLRFVMFRHGDVDGAWRQLKQAAAWRQERRVEDVLSEGQWSRHKELQAEMFWIGRDVDGRPTMVLRSIAHHPGAIDSEDFQRYFLFLLEQGRQLWGLGSDQQLNIVVDRIGAGIKNQDPRLLRTMLPVFRDAYPDMVYRCYVAPSSWIFRFVWVIAARLVDERQRKRVLLLQGEWQSRLLEDFDPSVLPPHLGGTMPDYPPKQPSGMA